MRQVKADDINQDIFDLFDDYVHDRISRRTFFSRVTQYTAAGISAAAIFDFLSPRYAEAQQIAEDDPRLKNEMLTYESPKGAGTMNGLLSRKVDNKDKLPGIVVVHENRGLNPHIRDVARRTALEGFIAFAPDALFPFGGYPGTDDEGRAMQGKRDRNEMLEDFIAAFQFLKSHPECDGNVGVVGFCFGGWIANMMAVRIADLKASVPFYGGQPSEEETAMIKAPLLLHYAELDKRVNDGWPAYESALKKYNKEYTAFVYPGVNHGFHNDTTPRYDETAAKLAWKRTVEFFKAKVK